VLTVRTRPATSCAHAARPAASRARGTRIGAASGSASRSACRPASLRGDHLDDRHAECTGKRRRVHGDAARQRLVNHVQGEQDRPLVRRDLGGEHQGPADISRVSHLDNQVGLTALQYVPGDSLVFADGSTERIDPRRVDDVADLQRPRARVPWSPTLSCPGSSRPVA
jgi:hypothetical protein